MVLVTKRGSGDRDRGSQLHSVICYGMAIRGGRKGERYSTHYLSLSCATFFMCTALEMESVIS